MAAPATPRSRSIGASLTSNTALAGFGSSSRSTGSKTPTSGSTAYLMPASPAKNRRPSSEGQKPHILKTTGPKPACLVNASITYCGNDQIYAFGGFDQFTDEVYNHVLRLNLKTLNWALVDNYGDIPGVRMGHSASLYQGDKLLVYGGENEHREYLSDVVILDLKDHHWTQPEISGPIPKGRARHAAVVYEDKLFVIGGLTGETNYILDDICYLDLKTWTWSRTWTFVERFDHTAWVWGGRLWVLGGLGREMERSTEIWWLDLKGNPSLGFSGSSRQNSAMGRAPGSRNENIGAPSRNDRSDTYAANSGSIHIRSSRRDKPTAPGAISSLRFVSGVHAPLQSSGTHFYVCSSGALLDFVTPTVSTRSGECSLSSLELDSLRWQKLVEGPEMFHPGYKWHYCTINEDGTKVWLLGSPTEDAGNTAHELQLSEVLSVDLRRYGMLGNELAGYPSEQNRILASERQIQGPLGLGSDLASMLDQPPDSGSMTDFVITANVDPLDDTDDEDDFSSSQTPASTRYSTNTSGSQDFVSESSTTSPQIHVHKIILNSRWPHFRRLYASKMVEYQTSSLHIPEPYSVVRAFLYYLYTDSIAPHQTYCRNLTDVAGMLVMANLYDMPKLRLLCVNRLSREIDIEHAAVIWERAGRTDEDWLKARAARFCMKHWGRVVRTEGFKGLRKSSMMELCEIGGIEGRIVGGDDADDGSEGFGFGGSSGHGTGVGRAGSRQRSHRPSDVTVDEDDEVDEADGMDVN